MILSDELGPNFQRLQDYTANLGINAKDGIHVVLEKVPGIPICSGWIPNTVFPMYFLLRVAILAKFYPASTLEGCRFGQFPSSTGGADGRKHRKMKYLRRAKHPSDC